MVSKVCLRPRTEEARFILERYGDVWEVSEERPDPIYGSVRRLKLERGLGRAACPSDDRTRGMWVREKLDELFEVVWL